MIRFLLLLFFLGSAGSLSSQQLDYLSRGAASYLVNYGAIRDDPFAARFAAKRFSLIDEGTPREIALMRSARPSLPILVYKDVVALHASHAEYKAMDRIEPAFMHSTDPAALVTLERNDTVWCAWTPDRRNAPHAYTLMFFEDSLSRDGIIATRLSAARQTVVPKQGAFVQLFTELDSGTIVPYSGRVPVRPLLHDTPYLYPADVGKMVTTDEPMRAAISITAGSIGTVVPDSVVAVIDLNRDNRLDTLRETKNMKQAGSEWTTDTMIVLPGQSGGGYEFVLYAYKDSRRFRFPAGGMYTTNTNNRLMNDYYGFFIMNPGNASWRQSYVSEVLRFCTRNGYNGLFEDDCWYRIESWGVDAFPPVDYDEITWRRNLFAFLDTVRASIHPFPAYFNGLYAEVSDSLLLHTDGGMTEGFGYTHWSGHVTGNSWRTLCNLGLKAQQRYRRTWLALGGAPYHDPEARLYVLGSYLLVADSLSLYANATNYQEMSHFPEFDLPLGRPRVAAVTSVDELRVTQSSPPLSYYTRAFEHGVVVVNPNSTGNVSFNPGPSRWRVTVDTFTTLRGGRLASRPADTIIPPKSARIYLGSTAGVAPRLFSPDIRRMQADPDPAPADGTTPVALEVEALDSSSAFFMSDSTKPLQIIADCGAVGGPSELALLNGGEPANASPSVYRGLFTIPVGAPPTKTSIPVMVHSPTGLVTVGHVPLTIRAADSLNLALNYSFEIDNDNDGIPDLWRSYVKGFDYDTSAGNAKSGRRSVHVRNDTLTEYRGISASITLNQTVPRSLELSGWSKALNVSGMKDADYSLYVDIRYQDDTPLYGQTAQFSTGTHDWEYASRTITPEKPIRSLTLYALFRRHTGEAWFDHLALRPAPVNGIVSPAAPRAAVIVGQPYPQPARDEITIPFSLASPMAVRLEIFDALGRCVGLVSNAGAEAGDHVMPYSIARLPSGWYTARLSTSHGIEHRPFIVRPK